MCQYTIDIMYQNIWLFCSIPSPIIVVNHVISYLLQTDAFQLIFCTKPDSYKQYSSVHISFIRLQLLPSMCESYPVTAAEHIKTPSDSCKHSNKKQINKVYMK